MLLAAGWYVPAEHATHSRGSVCVSLLVVPAGHAHDWLLAVAMSGGVHTKTMGMGIGISWPSRSTVSWCNPTAPSGSAMTRALYRPPEMAWTGMRAPKVFNGLPTGWSAVDMLSTR